MLKCKHIWNYFSFFDWSQSDFEWDHFRWSVKYIESFSSKSAKLFPLRSKHWHNRDYTCLNELISHWTDLHQKYNGTFTASLWYMSWDSAQHFQNWVLTSASTHSRLILIDWSIFNWVIHFNWALHPMFWMQCSCTHWKRLPTDVNAKSLRNYTCIYQLNIFWYFPI